MTCSSALAAWLSRTTGKGAVASSPGTCLLPRFSLPIVFFLLEFSTMFSYSACPSVQSNSTRPRAQGPGPSFTLSASPLCLRTLRSPSASEGLPGGSSTLVQTPKAPDAFLDPAEEHDDLSRGPPCARGARGTRTMRAQGLVATRAPMPCLRYVRST